MNHYSLRPAVAADLSLLAEHLVELYHAELPGVLVGPRAGQVTFFRHILAGSGSGNLHGRYLLVDQHGLAVASAGLRLANDPPFPTIPPGTVSNALRHLGFWHTIGLFGTFVRASLTPETSLGPHDAYIHSVVVRSNQRSQGLGGQLMGALEQVAVARGARSISLRVIVGNHRARQFYLRLGYRVVERTPPWLAWLTYPTETLIKPLLNQAA